MHTQMLLIFCVIPVPILASDAQTNLALFKPTAQSTNLGGYPSSNAVDGIIYGHSENLFSHTQPGGTQWWYVDMGDVYPIGSVVVYNRGTIYNFRLAGVSFLTCQIMRSDPSLNALSYWTRQYYQNAAFGDAGNIRFNPPVYARYLAILTESGEPLTLREVQAYPARVSGSWTLWSGWSACPVSCGGASRTRERSCTNPAPAFGGADCAGDRTETTDCNNNSCPVDGNWSLWTSFTSCSASCGGGNQTRERTCTSPAPAYGGSNCFGEAAQTAVCNTNPCPVSGSWSLWSGWSVCPVSCGGASRTRERSCTNPAPAFGGADCAGDRTETTACNNNSCPVDGNWSSWTLFTSCSASCGGGNQTRERTCTNPTPVYGGSNCSGQAAQTAVCNTKSCPVHGNWSLWSSWSSCTVSCGTGTRIRNRTCSNPAPAHGGSNCLDDQVQTADCAVDPCAIHGNWSSWNSWSSCTVSCGTGTRIRNRTCSNPAPAYGGSNCLDDQVQTADCAIDLCADQKTVDQVPTTTGMVSFPQSHLGVAVITISAAFLLFAVIIIILCAMYRRSGSPTVTGFMRALFRLQANTTTDRRQTDIPLSTADLPEHGFENPIYRGRNEQHDRMQTKALLYSTFSDSA